MSEIVWDVATWTPEEVAKWMEGLNKSGVAPHIPQFVKSDVTGSRLLNITFAELEELGVSKVGHQEMILEAIDLLCALQSSLHEDGFEKLATALLSASQRMVQLLINGTTRQEGQSGNDDARLAALDRDSQLTSAATAILTSTKKLVTHLDRNAASHVPDYRTLRQTLLQSVLSISSNNQQGSEENTMQLNETCKTLTSLAEQLLDSCFTQSNRRELPVLRTVSLTPQSGKGLGFCIRATFEGILVISKIIPDSPADQSGMISVGDELVQVNGRTVVGWQLPSVIAVLKEKRFNATVMLKHMPAGPGSAVLKGKSSTGALSVSSHHSSVSSLSSTGNLKESSQPLDRTKEPNENGEIEQKENVEPPCEAVVEEHESVDPPCEPVVDQHENIEPLCETVVEQNENKVKLLCETVTEQSRNLVESLCDAITEPKEKYLEPPCEVVESSCEAVEEKCEDPQLEDSGNSSANETTEESEKQHDEKARQKASDNEQPETKQEVKETQLTVVESALECDRKESDSVVAEKLDMNNDQLEQQAQVETEGPLQETLPGADENELEESTTVVQNDKVSNNSPKAGDIVEANDNKVNPKTESEDSTDIEHAIPLRERRYSSSSVPPTPMVSHIAAHVPIREVSSARTSPRSSPRPRRPVPWFPPPPKEPHPDDLILLLARRKLSKLVQAEEIATGRPQQKDEKQEVAVNKTVLDGNVEDKAGKSGHNEKTGDVSDGLVFIPTEVQTTVPKEKQKTDTENVGGGELLEKQFDKDSGEETMERNKLGNGSEEKKGEDEDTGEETTKQMVLQNGSQGKKEEGKNIRKVATGGKSLDSDSQESNSNSFVQKSKLGGKLSVASSSGSLHSIEEGNGWGYSTKVVGGVVTRFPMKLSEEERLDEVSDTLSESAVSTSKSKRGWSFKFKSLKKEKKKKQKVSVTEEESQKWTGIGAQDMISEDSETSSVTSGDAGCYSFRGKKSPSSKSKNSSRSSSRKTTVQTESEDNLQGLPTAAQDDQECDNSSLRSATPDQHKRLHTPEGGRHSGQVSLEKRSGQVSLEKRSAGKKRKQLDLQRFSAYAQRPGDPNTKFSDVNEVVMQGQTVKEVTVIGKKGLSLSTWQPGSASTLTSCRSIEDPDCEGWLTKQGGSGITPKNWRRRWFVLKNNCLYYYKSSFDQSALGVVTLHNYTISLAPEIKRQFSFKASREKSRTYYFVADNQEDMTKWMEKLTEATAAASGSLISGNGMGTGEVESSDHLGLNVSHTDGKT